MASFSVRPMDAGSIDAVARLCAETFAGAGDVTVARRWRDRVAYLLTTDPAGSFVGELDGQIRGVSQAVRREGLWCLSLLAVDPSFQSKGAGRALFGAALDYCGHGPGLIVSSNDHRALRLYAAAGFSLHPALQASGRVDRRRLPLRDGDVCVSELHSPDWLSAVSRDVRGAAYGAEIDYALERGAQLVQLAERGFAVAEPGRGVWMLIARDEASASSLLWTALEVVGSAERPVRWIPGVQDWAVRVVLQAGLEVSAYGALCVRGDPGPLRPFLPSEPFA
jgi:GNAT superfamily N-acetyltransferase